MQNTIPCPVSRGLRSDISRYRESAQFYLRAAPHFSDQEMMNAIALEQRLRQHMARCPFCSRETCTQPAVAA